MFQNACRCARVERDPAVPAERRATERRRLLVHGTREDVLERLPRHCRHERLVLSAGAVSLVCPCARVDALLLGESGYRRDGAWQALTLLELRVAGRSRAAVDGFAEGLRLGLRAAALH